MNKINLNLKRPVMAYAFAGLPFKKKMEVARIFRTREPTKRIDMIEDLVCEFFNFDTIRTFSRKKELVLARYIVMWFMFNHGYNKTRCGLRFRQDHTTAIHGLKAVNNDLKCKYNLTVECVEFVNASLDKKYKNKKNVKSTNKSFERQGDSEAVA